MENTSHNYQEVISFWFEEVSPKQWWVKDQEFDNLIRQRFEKLHSAALKGELWAWRNTALGALAEIIVIDQFSRNIYRNMPQSFVYDPIALILAQNTISQKFDQELAPTMRGFVYLPFMHSESALIHQEAVKLYQQDGMNGNLDFELKHKVIIDRFGRYPHRNIILGRESTLEEVEFLKTDGSSF
ncbi:MAG: DUF924 domain-containing protein [Burkholderiales bacterium]|nr:DUF924 domain-containing protein [Burkholderiales bacterium]